MVVASIMCRDNENVTPSWRSGFTSAVDSSSGLVVRIPGSHPGGPGSIPGNGMDILLFLVREGNDEKKCRRGWDSNPRGQSPLD